MIQNGYVSNTLKTIQIGTKTKGEWLGEDLLIMQDPLHNVYEYSAIAVTKLDTYVINFSDMKKITQGAYRQMENVAKARKQVIVQRTLNLYNNLKSIKNKLEVGETTNISQKKLKEHHSKEAFKLGQKIQIMVEKEKRRNSRSPSPNKTGRGNRSPNNKGHVGVRQYGKFQLMKNDGKSSMSMVSFPQIIANPRDADMKSRLDNASPTTIDRFGIKTYNTVNLDSEAIKNYKPKRNVGKSSKFEYMGNNTLNQSYETNNSFIEGVQSPPHFYPGTDKKDKSKFQQMMSDMIQRDSPKKNFNLMVMQRNSSHLISSHSRNELHKDKRYTADGAINE